MTFSDITWKRVPQSMMKRLELDDILILHITIYGVYYAYVESAYQLWFSRSLTIANGIYMYLLKNS